MQYKYEIHSHTKESSRCGKLSAMELVKKYKSLGYSGVVITNHYSPMTFHFNEFFNKKKAIEHYLKGYREAKKYEDEHFSVLLGMEIRFEENEVHYNAHQHKWNYGGYGVWE